MEELGCSEDTLQEFADLEADFNSEANSSTAMEKSELSNPNSVYTLLYKVNSLSSSQDKRRKILLNIQKTNRNKSQDENRDVSEFLISDDEEEMITDSVLDLKLTISNSRKKPRYSKARAMYSEWLTEIPSDLESDWSIKLCPIGVRNIIIANKFRTWAFKNGKLVAKFNSNLPAGRRNSGEKDSLTILDCIYNRSLKCIFVLDVLVWKGCNLCKSPASLRFYWLKSRLSEIPVREITTKNECRIVEVPEFPADLSTIEEKLAQPFREFDEIIPLDGILFYHKETWYMPGSHTPLVGWLKPYMIPEKLHIPICEYFMYSKPNNYVSFEHYIKKHVKHKNDVTMKDDNVEEQME